MKRILVVDDKEEVRMVYLLLFGDEGLEVLEAGNGLRDVFRRDSPVRATEQPFVHVVLRQLVDELIEILVHFIRMLDRNERLFFERAGAPIPKEVLWSPHEVRKAHAVEIEAHSRDAHPALPAVRKRQVLHVTR